jgi:hypothetical protein
MKTLFQHIYTTRGSAVSWKVAGSIPDEVIGIFNLSNPSSRTMALGSTQPLNRNEYQESSWGEKGGRRVRLQLHRHIWADCLENVGALTSHKQHAQA